MLVFTKENPFFCRKYKEALYEGAKTMTSLSNTLELKKARIPFHYYGKIDRERIPIIFIHGAGGNGTLWTQQMEGLSNRYALLAVDLPGHGKSGGKAANLVSSYRDYLNDFLESAGVSKAVLCGHSMGGAIGLDFVLTYPESVEALILVSSGGRLRVAPKILETYRQGHTNPSLVRHLYGPDAPEDLVREGEAMLEKVPPETSYADFSACDRFNVMDRLHEIDRPVLIICGEHDGMTPPKYSRFLCEAINGARLELLPTGGHMIMQEKGDDVNSAIDRFLKDQQIT